MDQNLPKRTQISDRSKSNLGLFLVEFSKLLKIKEKFGGFGGGNTSQIRGNHALIPYDEVWTSRVAQSSRIDERVGELTQEHEEHKRGKLTNWITSKATRTKSTGN